MVKINRHYISLHYNVIKYYRNKYGKYISFKKINRNIQRQMQIMQIMQMMIKLV